MSNSFFMLYYTWGCEEIYVIYRLGGPVEKYFVEISNTARDQGRGMFLNRDEVKKTLQFWYNCCLFAQHDNLCQKTLWFHPLLIYKNVKLFILLYRKVKFIYFLQISSGRNQWNKNPSVFCNLIGCSSGWNFTIFDHGPES